MTEDRERSGQDGGKPFVLDKQWFVEAWKKVKANKGGPGVDGVTIDEFESRLGDEVFKLWNRMSSGSYFPAPVKAVPIPKVGGGTRVLGVPTVADRVAQTVVANLAGPASERVFVEDSYGFRPSRGALDAVRVARRRCGEYDWVVDVDISAFFDSVDHGLLMRAVEWQGWPRWAMICVRRWIAAPMLTVEGGLVPRDRGTPQGGVISPVLANLFLHVGVDVWMGREFPEVPFERYADDMVCHCRTRMTAQRLVEELGRRLSEIGLVMHPGKTKIVYCKDYRRRGGGMGHTGFVFLGFEFRARSVKTSHGIQDVFLPAPDPVKLKGLRSVIKQWRIPRLVNLTWEDLASWINPWVRGWMGYYACFTPSDVFPVLRYLNAKLFMWMRGKRRYSSVKKAAIQWNRITTVFRGLFYHWRYIVYNAYP